MCRQGSYSAYPLIFHSVAIIIHFTCCDQLVHGVDGLRRDFRRVRHGDNVRLKHPFLFFFHFFFKTMDVFPVRTMAAQSSHLKKSIKSSLLLLPALALFVATPCEEQLCLEVEVTTSEKSIKLSFVSVAHGFF